MAGRPPWSVPGSSCLPTRSCCPMARINSVPTWHEYRALASTRRQCCGRGYDVFHLGLNGPSVISIDNLVCGLPALLRKLLSQGLTEFAGDGCLRDIEDSCLF